MRVDEGKQYFVNRITFVGNTTTRDNVIRREMRLLEGGVFNTEALKYSVRRLNQLGYFKPLEGEADRRARRPPNADNKVDVKLKFEEQNRNQLTFGAGVSQFDGFFGQLSFQTSNFLGRGETLHRLAAAGQPRQELSARVQRAVPVRSADHRPASTSSRARSATTGSSRRSPTGGNIVFGFPLADFTRMFVNYSYERVKVKDLNPLYHRAAGPRRAIRSCTTRCSSARAGAARSARSRRASCSTPSTTRSSRRAASASRSSFDLRRARRQHVVLQAARRRHLVHAAHARAGRRSASAPQVEYICRTAAPRAADLREAVPRRRIQHARLRHAHASARAIRPPALVVGGNKSLLFNAEYLITIAGPVRLVLFYDAGQVRDVGQSVRVEGDVTRHDLSGRARPLTDHDLYSVFDRRSTSEPIR